MRLSENSFHTTATVGYLYEHYNQDIYNFTGTSGTAALTPANGQETVDPSNVNTVTVFVRYDAIPDTLNTELRYTASHGVDQIRLLPTPTAAPAGQFPDTTDWFQRLDAVATYTFDKDWVARMGWTGKVKATLHYAWERNSVANWQNDGISPYDPLISASAIWLAYNNPNYNVHLLMASVKFQW